MIDNVRCFRTKFLDTMTITFFIEMSVFELFETYRLRFSATR